MSIPIVGANRAIVGWTERIPEVSGGILRHTEAEKLVGGRVAAVYVEIHDPNDASRSGAPAGWEGPWRCLAICSERAIGTERRTFTTPSIRLQPREKR